MLLNEKVGDTIDPLGHRVTVVYDGANRLRETHVSPGDGVEYVTARYYDGAGRVTMTQFPDLSTYGYNWQYPEGDGYCQEIDELQHVTTRTWNKAGLPVKEVDPNGNIVFSQYYDALNRVFFVQSQRAVNLGPSQASWSFAYDEVSNRVAVIDALGNRQTSLFDFLNRPTTMVQSTGSLLLTTSQDYNARGSVQYQTDARGNTVTLYYDFNQRMTARQDPLGGYTSFSYDRTGRRTAVQAPLIAAGAAITSMAYEARGLLTTVTYADLSQELFSYDAGGRQTVHVLPDGSRISMSYDNLGQRTLLTPPPGQASVQEAYDPRGRRFRMQDGVGTTDFQYYLDGRLKQVIMLNGIVTSLYDAGGRRTGIVYTSGTVALGYDQDNNLTSVQNPFGESTGYAWDLANRLNTITLANGSLVSMRYDNANRLVYVGDNSNLASSLGFAYSLDPNGNRTVITENDGSQVNNTYDAKNRLTLETRTGTSPYSNGYSYDLNDNLTSVRGTGYSVDIMGRITNAGFVYDANGRLAARPGSDGTTYLNYDYAGRVTSMTLGAGLTITYALDGDGRAQRETRGGKNHYYLLDGKNVLKEWGTQTVTVTSSSGTPAGNVALRPRDLVRLATATGASVTVSITQEIIDYTHGLGLISDRTTISRWYRWDGIGSLRNLENGSGSIVASTVFDAYGLQQNSTTLMSAYGFIGEQGVRGEKGLAPGTLLPQNMRARMYDPLTGRFTSRDPIWDKNLYQYGNGNPWSYTDPTGKMSWDEFAALPWRERDLLSAYTDLRPDQLKWLIYVMQKINAMHGGRYTKTTENLKNQWVAELWRVLDSERGETKSSALHRARGSGAPPTPGGQFIESMEGIARSAGSFAANRTGGSAVTFWNSNLRVQYARKARAMSKRLLEELARRPKEHLNLSEQAYRERVGLFDSTRGRGTVGFQRFSELVRETSNPFEFYVQRAAEKVNAEIRTLPRGSAEYNEALQAVRNTPAVSEQLITSAGNTSKLLTRLARFGRVSSGTLLAAGAADVAYQIVEAPPGKRAAVATRAGTRFAAGAIGSEAGTLAGVWIASVIFVPEVALPWLVVTVVLSSFAGSMLATAITDAFWDVHDHGAFTGWPGVEPVYGTRGYYGGVDDNVPDPPNNPASFSLPPVHG